jgi:chemotaxis protein methyltransferase CheR
MKQSMPDFRQITAITTIVQDRTGLRFSDTQIQDLQRLLLSPEFLTAHPNLETLPQLLLAESTQHNVWQALIRCVTVSETYFFRNEPQFDALRTSVLPSLIEHRRQRGQLQLRLWSAGCATGEEPYSLAMLLQALLPDIEQWHITIMATDLNENNLERARRGLYRSWSFRNETPSDIRERWFTREGETLKLSSVIRRMVILKPLNLISEIYPSFETGTMNMDLILCRNVTIYFDQVTTQRIAQRFYDALNTEGWLVVGHAEPMSSVYAGFAACNFPNTVLYQKVALPNEEKPIVSTEFSLSTIKVPVPITVPVIRESKPSDVIPVKADTKFDKYWEHAQQAADAELWDIALTWLNRAQTEDQFQPQVYHLRALVQWQLGDMAEALSSLRQALYCDNSFALAHYTIAEVYETQRNHRLALRHWRLAQDSIEGLPSDLPLPFAQELTVEMLQSLLDQRLNDNEREARNRERHA